ncbi:hypothetical protein PILCRDRAFT_86767 [Piloderma croceum F 1598]|uniref:NmrA-like domain-containing protein n=1 Tax=Piloderma croceum (strain F 1598) TaxID=765440 RepID=A0A0C3G698_PILCF|nr:hypothetical protein PILCRDRAFT_86767 [Piloderma croceum F 1598]
MTISHEPSAPLVVVVGATGMQGGSVINALIESDKAYRFRGLTRDTSKPAARKLIDQGVEMVGVSISADNAEKVHQAFEGASIAFEIDDGILMINAAKAAKVKLFIWSGLMSVTEASGGKYTHVDHFDGKAAITAYGRQSGIPFVDVQAGTYASNFTSTLAPRKQADGTYAIGLPFGPDTLIPIIDMASDYGLFVRQAIESTAFGAGSEILTCGELLPVGDMFKQLSEITGKSVVFHQLSDKEYLAAMPEMIPDRIKVEFLDQMKYIDDFGYYNGKSVVPSQQQLARKPRTWAEFVKATDWSKVLA